MSNRQQIIDEYFDGDEARYEEEWEHAVQEGRLYVIQWHDLELAACTLPEFETEARNLIERRLGYLPHESSRLAHEPFLRALIQAYRRGELTAEAFSLQADEQIKLIRNEDLKANASLGYDPRIYQNYMGYLSDYRQKAKARLARFLGYEPELAHSLAVEMWLCEMMAEDDFRLPDYINAIDLKCHTLIKYREVLLAEGKDAADASPLLGLEPAIH